MADELLSLVRAIATGDRAGALRLLEQTPALATERVWKGATRAEATEHFFEAIRHYVYAGDTALHVAGAAYDREVARKLIALGADVSAKNRRKAEPLHYAVDGGPGSPSWNAVAQSAVIVVLLKAGADPNAVDAGGVTPLHRAVRNRCAAAVQTLLDGGADVHRKNGGGSTPMVLAKGTTGRSGAGSPGAKAAQAEIIRLLEKYGG